MDEQARVDGKNGDWPKSDALSYVSYRDRQHAVDPQTRDEYERLGPRFQAITQLLRARQQAGLTQADLAEALGTTRSAISRLESGRHSPSIDTVADAAAALGFDVVIRLVKRRPSNER